MGPAVSSTDLFFTDENGAFVQDVDYTAYGAALPAGTAATPAGSMKYSNEQWNGGDSLQGLGLHQLGARLYAPAIGRPEPPPVADSAQRSHDKSYVPG